jgi:hypothetical protein
MYYEFSNIVYEHVDLMPSEDGQLTETCKGNKYLHTNHTGRCQQSFYNLDYWCDGSE